jgi:hypothetical protein
MGTHLAAQDAERLFGYSMANLDSRLSTAFRTSGGAGS